MRTTRIIQMTTITQMTTNRTKRSLKKVRKLILQTLKKWICKRLWTCSLWSPSRSLTTFLEVMSRSYASNRRNLGSSSRTISLSYRMTLCMGRMLCSHLVWSKTKRSPTRCLSTWSNRLSAMRLMRTLWIKHASSTCLGMVGSNCASSF